MVLILLVLLLNGADTAPKPAKDRRFSFLRSVSVRLLLLDEPSQELRLSLTIFALLLKYRLRVKRGGVYHATAWWWWLPRIRC